MMKNSGGVRGYSKRYNEALGVKKSVIAYVNKMVKDGNNQNIVKRKQNGVNYVRKNYVRKGVTPNPNNVNYVRKKYVRKGVTPNPNNLRHSPNNVNPNQKKRNLR